MTSMKIRVANVLDVEPGQIRCLSLNENTLKLALFRGGKEPAIEIWDVSHIPFMEKVLTELEKVEDEVSVESLMWSHNRLFSCGLHGFLLEHDLIKLNIRSRSAATSGPVWCFGANPGNTHVAAGTEDGFVNIFEILEEGLSYVKVLDRQEGRVLCLSWSPCGKYIATGSVDSIRVWDVEKGHALQRMMTGRSKQTETIVWSIIMLDNFLIASGDSRGIISFWDGRVGVLRNKINTHKADILTLRLSSDTNSLYAAGVDPNVVLLVKTGRGNDWWVKSHQRVMHTNDVMALASYGNKLYSGGTDADLVVSSFPPKLVTKYAPVPKRSRVTVGKSNTDQIMIQNPKGIDIWKMPSDDTEELVKILKLKCRHDEQVESACQSPSGTLFAYATRSAINFFHMSLPIPNSTKRPELTKLTSPVDTSQQAVVRFLHFLNDTDVLGLSADGRMATFVRIDPTTKTITSKVVVKVTNRHLKGNSCHLGAVSACGTLFAVTSNTTGGILVLSTVFDEGLIQTVSLPSAYRYGVSSMAFHPKKTYLLITYVDHRVHVWNYLQHCLVYSEKITKQAELQPLIGSAWSSDTDMVVLHQVDKLYLLKMEDLRDSGHVGKRTRKSSLVEPIEEKVGFEIQCGGTNYKYIAYCAFTTTNELVVVEVKPNSIIAKLPPAFTKKRFGM